MRTGVSLLGSEPEPAHGFSVILRHTAALGVHSPEVVLRTGVSLLGSEPEPAHGFSVILRHTAALGVHSPES